MKDTVTYLGGYTSNEIAGYLVAFATMFFVLCVITPLILAWFSPSDDPPE